LRVRCPTDLGRYGRHSDNPGRRQTYFRPVAQAHGVLWGAIVPKPPRWLLPSVVYEITARTLGGQFLFRPDDASREAILGSIGRALSLNHDIALHGFVFLSNHCHILISSSTGGHISSFLGQLKSNVARKIGHLRRRSGKLWEENSTILPVTDDEALLSRTRYLLSQSVKEGLVEHPEEWPGASSLPWSLGEELTGSWIDRSLQRKASRQRDGGDPSTYTFHYPIRLSPLPCWKGLSRFEIKSRTMTIIEGIAEEARLRRLYDVMGIEAILATDPLERPAQSLKRRRAPRCHSSSQHIRKAFHAVHRAFVAAFRTASRALRKHGEIEKVPFPFGSFPPAGQFVVAPLNYYPPWSSAVDTSWRALGSIPVSA
jgi:REP element-mobilizing transposase RayT